MSHFLDKLIAKDSRNEDLLFYNKEGRRPHIAL